MRITGGYVGELKTHYHCNTRAGTCTRRNLDGGVPPGSPNPDPGPVTGRAYKWGGGICWGVIRGSLQ